VWRTTICCSALALTTVGLVRAAPSESEPLALFPLRTLWTLTLSGPLAAPPLFSGSRAYIPLEFDRLGAFDLETGEEQWVLPARTLSQPTAGDGLVFIAEPGGIAAFRESDGIQIWRRPFFEQLATPLVWDGGWLIAATTTGTFLALRAIDGYVVWRRDLDSAVSAPPVLAGDRVYAPAANGRVLALRIETGELVWERRLGGTPNEILALGDRLYVGSQDNFLYCLTARNGEIDWRWRTGGDVIGTPVGDQRRIYFVSLDNILRALDRRSGAQRWKRPLSLRPVSGPLLAGSTIIVSGVAPPLRAFQTSDGTPAGDVPVQGELAAPAYVLNGPALPMLVVVARDIAKGTTITAFTRAVDPAIVAVAPLQNLLEKPVGPAGPPAPASPGDPAALEDAEELEDPEDRELEEDKR
jgi:outer membrane protein assembly factor BamB